MDTNTFFIKKTENIDFFTISYFTWFIYEIINYTTIKGDNYGALSKYAYLIAVVGFVLEICKGTWNDIRLNRISSMEQVVKMIILIAAVLSWKHTEQQALFLIIIMMLATKNVDFTKIVRIAFCVYTLVIITCTVLSLFGAIDNLTFPRPDGHQRYSMGFAHPNALGLYLFSWISCFAYLNRNKAKRVVAVSGIVIAIYTYLVPHSRTACIACILVVAVYLVSNVIRREKLKTSVLCWCSIIMALMANIISVVFSTHSIQGYPALIWIDRIMSGRFSTCYEAWQYYGSATTIWGRNAVYGVAAYERGLTSVLLHLDNSYMRLLIVDGVIMYLIISIVWLFAIWHSWKKERIYLALILTVFSIYAITEGLFWTITRNVFLIAASKALYDHIKDIMLSDNIKPLKEGIKYISGNKNRI